LGPKIGGTPELSDFRSLCLLKENVMHMVKKEHLPIGLPIWLPSLYWLILTVFIASIVYLTVFRITRSVTGPVVIIAISKKVVTASKSGLVVSVNRAVGDRVRTGDIVVEFQVPPGKSHDRSIGEVRAPISGTISDIRVRQGQEIPPGYQVATIVDETSGYEALAFFSAAYVPKFRSEMRLVLKFKEYPGTNDVITANTTNAEIIEPYEVKRYFGDDKLNGMNFSEPVVIAHSFLPIPRFEVGPQSYAFHDGMIGLAQVSVRSDPMILGLIPGLKEGLSHLKKLTRFD
jgi:hypothetical protein